MSKVNDAVSIDLKNSNFWASDVAGDDAEYLGQLEERRCDYENLAIRFSNESNCVDFLKGLRWSEVDFTYSVAERVANLGIFFHIGASDRSIEIAIAHLVGLAKYSKFETKSHASRYGRGRPADEFFGNLSRLMYADEISLTLTDATVEEWAEWALDWLEQENVDVRKEMPCGGESIVLRYKHLLSYVVSDIYQPGDFVDIQSEMVKFGYVHPIPKSRFCS